MPQVSSSFTHREVLRALRQAGWGRFLPAEEDLEGGDDVCVEFTAEISEIENHSTKEFQQS